MSGLKIVASQALFLICKHLPHFLYQRKAVSPGRLSRSYPYFALKIAANTYPSFAIATAHVYGLATMGAICLSSLREVVWAEDKELVATHVTFAVYSTSPEMVLTFILCGPDLNLCDMIKKKKKANDVFQLSSFCSLLPLPHFSHSQEAMAIDHVSGQTMPVR